MGNPDDPAPSLPWTTTARRLWIASRIVAVALPVTWIVAWAVGTTLSDWSITGTLRPRFGYSLEIFYWALSAAALVVGAGYAVALAVRVEASAQALARSMGDRTASHPAGDAARRQVAALNQEIDDALARLAEAESLIRQQVRAIDSAGDALEHGRVKSAERLEQERQALIHLTEEMNREAERFAETIASKSKAAAETHKGLDTTLAERERSFDGQLERLETVSADSIERFERLAAAMEAQNESFLTASSGSAEQQSAIAEQIEKNADRIESAQADLAEQSARLEKLLADQRQRADRVAQVVSDAIPEQLKGSSPSAKDAPRQATPWRDILQTVERAMPSETKTKNGTSPVSSPSSRELKRPDLETEQKPVPASKTADHGGEADEVQRLVVRVQNYSLVLQTQLFGSPDHEELDRFEGGERQLFARKLIARSDSDLRQRISAELGNNAVFRDRTADFLRDFDGLLEAVTIGDEGTDTIEEYLATPMGKIYLSAGSAAGHFPSP